jgi:hypothetical protein
MSKKKKLNLRKLKILSISKHLLILRNISNIMSIIILQEIIRYAICMQEIIK